MADKDNWLNDARSRLAKVELRPRRLGSIAAKVHALQPEIQAARDAGKTWSQVAAAISDGGPLNADTVRVALARSSKAVDSATPVTRRDSRAAALSTPTPKPVEIPNNMTAKEDGISDMFGPMFDARDTRGRGRQNSSVEENGS